MDESTINWYLINMTRPGFVKAIVDENGEDGWKAVKEKLLLSMRYWGVEIPESLEGYLK